MIDNGLFSTTDNTAINSMIRLHKRIKYRFSTAHTAVQRSGQSTVCLFFVLLVAMMHLDLLCSCQCWDTFAHDANTSTPSIESRFLQCTLVFRFTRSGQALLLLIFCPFDFKDSLEVLCSCQCRWWVRSCHKHTSTLDRCFARRIFKPEMSTRFRCLETCGVIFWPCSPSS